MKQQLYLQLSDQLRTLILNDEYKYGQRFPSERELEIEYQINRKTIRKALNILVQEKFLIRIKGKGTYVNKPRMLYQLKSARGFSRLFTQEGIKVTSKVISSSREKADYIVSKALEILPGDPVNKLVRLRLVEDEPIALEYTYIRDIIPNFQEIDFSVYSLYDVFEMNGNNPVSIHEEIETVIVSNSEAQLLKKEPGSWVFLVTDITRNQLDEVIEFNKAYTNNERIILSTDLT